MYNIIFVDRMYTITIIIIDILLSIDLITTKNYEKERLCVCKMFEEVRKKVTTK